jgi:ribonuclease HI
MMTAEDGLAGLFLDKAKAAQEYEKNFGTPAPADKLTGFLTALKKNQSKEAATSKAVDTIEKAHENGATVVYVDGGYYAKQDVGVAGYLIALPGHIISPVTTPFRNTSNNRMEMRAAIAALEVIEIGKPALVVTDSAYIFEGVQFWTKKWEKNGWKTADGDPVKNRDLWEILVMLRDLHQVTWLQVKSHAETYGNNVVDQACFAALQLALEQSKASLPKDLDIPKAVAAMPGGSSLKYVPSNTWIAHGKKPGLFPNPDPSADLTDE